VAPERSTRASILRRLVGRSQAARHAIGASFIKEAEQLSRIPAFDAALKNAIRLSSPLQRLIATSGLSMTVGVFVLLSGCAALAAGLVLWLVTRQPLLSVLGGALALFLPYVWVRRARTMRLRKFEEQFPEAIELIARALRAGHAFSTGLGMVADELPAPVGPEFRLLYDRQNFGMSLPDAMKAFAQQVPLIDARFFVTAVLTQRESGGNLSEVLDNLSSVIRERFRVKRQIRVVSAHGRLTGWILCLLPPVLAVLLSMANPKAMRLLIEDPLGVRMVIVAVVLQVVGTLAIRRLVDIEY
jgi:tight adherence protein B